MVKYLNIYSLVVFPAIIESQLAFVIFSLFNKSKSIVAHQYSAYTNRAQRKLYF